MKELLNLALAFLRVGVFGYGGGPSMVPLIQYETVEKYKWMTENEFIDAFILGNTLPGPIALKMSAFVGYKVSGVPGVIISVFMVSLPSVIMMLVLTSLYFTFKDKPFVKGVMKAVGPVILALLFMIVWDVFPETMIDWSTIVIGVISFIVMQFFKVHPAYVVLVSIILGGFVYSK